MKKIKQALILAAGDSTRFWPFKRKSLVPFLGKPLVEHLIGVLSRFASETVLVVNESDQELFRASFQSELFKKRFPHIRILVQNKNQSGMAGAVLTTKGRLTGETLVMNAEDVVEPGLFEQFMKKLNESNFDFLFAAKKVDSYFPGGYVKFSNGNVAEIVEKPDPKKTPSNIIKLVLDYFSDIGAFTEVLDDTTSTKDDRYEQAVNRFIQKGVKTAFVPYDGSWLPLKFPWHTIPMMKYFLSTLAGQSISKTATISHQALIEGPVIIEDGVKIGAFAQMKGPCFVGRESIIGDYAMVRESQVGQKTVVGGYSEVTRSYLGDSVSLHRNYVGDSVLGNGVSMGAGAATANFRFDGKTIKNSNLVKLGALVGDRSKIGVNATTLPGVKIGSRTFIGPGVVVTDDIEDSIFFFQGKKIKNRA